MTGFARFASVCAAVASIAFATKCEARTFSWIALGSSFEAAFVALTQRATPTSPPPGPQVKARRSRAAFAAAMNRMWLAHSRGVDFTPEQVRSILGPPDEVPLPNDPTWHAAGTIWLYGTNGPHTMPTLGWVGFWHGELSDVVGMGVPPSPKVIGEAELLGAMRWIYGSRSEPKPLRLIQVANRLIRMGRRKSFAVLGEYSRMGADDSGDDDWLFWLVRVVFQSELPDGVFAVPMIAVVPPADLRKWPTYPVLLVDDVPFCVPRVCALGGRPESFGGYLYVHGKEWVIRTNPLKPPDDPFLSYVKLILSATWKQARDYGRGYDADFNERSDRDTAFGQVIALVRTVVRPAFVSWPRHEDFDKYHREFLGLGCRWDAARQMYVRKDGSVLPDEPRRP